MKILDFHRSFIVFEMDFDKFPPKTVSDMRQNTHNRARIRIDCRCEITDPGGKTVNYYLGEACKTERVGADRQLGIFLQPNADFRPVVSEVDTAIFKSWDKNDKGVMLVPASLGPQPERQIIKTSEAFNRQFFILNYNEGTVLTDINKIVKVTDAGKPLVARTEYTQAGFHVVLDYPLVTFNVSERHKFYQTDTGPVVYPELAGHEDRVAEGFRLAFCAFNNPDWIEFVVQKPTPVGDGISVNHYSEQVWVDCKNSIIATGRKSYDGK